MELNADLRKALNRICTSVSCHIPSYDPDSCEKEEIELPYNNIYIEPPGYINQDKKDWRAFFLDLSDDQYKFILNAGTNSEQFISNGKEIVFLVRKYHNNNYDYYYHLTYCNILKKRTEDNIRRYFYTTTKHDGYFLTQVDQTEEYNLVKGKVCSACFSALKLWGKYDRENFDINKYYIENSFKISRLNKLNNFSVQSNNQDGYNTFWRDLSRKIKEKRGCKCERCGRIFDISELDVHHKDKNKNNIMPDNLQVLCTECHDKEHPYRPKK